jgi:hypothetical protein
VKASLDQENLGLREKENTSRFDEGGGLLSNNLPIVSCLAFSFSVDSPIWGCIPSFVSNGDNDDDADSAGGARFFSNVLFIEVVNFRHVVFEKDWLRFLPHVMDF